MLNPTILQFYNQIRTNTDKSKVCHAPFVNLNFEQNGHVTTCCFNRVDVLGVYPENSLLEIWNGVSANAMRKKIENLDLTGGCKLCGILLESGNFSGSKAIHYDEYARVNPLDKFLDVFRKKKYLWPKVLEFEISNTCNLECEMCSGYYSSTIRKNREKLPAIHDPYDDDFVQQLESFIPHLTDMKFLGGEPFLIDRYYQIWEKVAEINPKIKIHITTNGTIFNQRVKNLLEKLNVGIVVSLDSLNSQRYADIRKGSQLDKVLKNISLFKDVVNKKNTYLTLAACVMTNNWMDMAKLLRYCNENHFNIHFNIVWNPEKFSLRFLDYVELDQIILQLNSEKFELGTNLHQQNFKVYQDMITTINHWKNERSFTRLHEYEGEHLIEFRNIDIIHQIPKDLKERFYVLMNHYVERKSNLFPQWNLFENKIGEIVPSADILIYLQDLVNKEGDVLFLENHFRLLPFIYDLLYGNEGKDEFINKSNLLFDNLLKYNNKAKLINDMILDIDKRGYIPSFNMILSNDLEVLMSHMDTIYFD